MAEFKRRTLILCTGKQIKLYGNSIAIGPSREIGQGAAPDIFSELISHLGTKMTKEKTEPTVETPTQLFEQASESIDDSIATDGKTKKKKSAQKEVIKPEVKVSNPYKLTAEEIHDLADYNIQLWMDLKNAVRRHGTESNKVFNQE